MELRLLQFTEFLGLELEQISQKMSFQIQQIITLRQIRLVNLEMGFPSSMVKLLILVPLLVLQNMIQMQHL